MMKGKKYPHLQRARIGKCLICGKEYRAIHDFKIENKNIVPENVMRKNG